LSQIPGHGDEPRPARDVAEVEADLKALTRAYEVQARRLAMAEQALADLEAERRRRLVAPFLRFGRRVRRAARSARARLSGGR
jgi:hypothetical protein